MRKNWTKQILSDLWQRRSIPFMPAALGHFALVALLFFLSQGRAAEFLRAKFSLPLHFRARDLLGQSPALDPRIKIYGIDDSAFAYLGNWVLSTDQWLELLQAMDAAGPRAILIDAMFSKVIGDAKRLGSFARIRAPIYVGGFVSNDEIPHKPPFEAFDESHALSSETFRQGMPSYRFFHSYAPELAKVFDGVGHFMYTPDFTIQPLYLVGERYLVRHMVLNLADELRFTGPGSLAIDRKDVRLGAQGGLLVNFSTPATYFEKTFGLEGIFKKIQLGKPVTSIKPNDIVVIIPHLYTGNTDLRPTPFGDLSGGYILVALLNSLLKGNWLDVHERFEGAAVLAFGLIGFFIAYFGSNLVFIGATFLLLGVLSLGSLLAFTHFDAVLPWLWPALACTLPGACVFVAKNRNIERRNANLKRAFSGYVSKDTLNSLMEQSHTVNLETTERILTVMFIDVVGFSISALNIPPKAAFQRLKETFGGLAEIIHRHGGIIDRTLGDGLLCYFGHSFRAVERGSLQENHADSALQCAIELQRDNIKRLIAFSHAEEAHAFPLRIGLNTTPCHLGNLGSSDRIDFTIVGNGVNFAKRLESCCTMNRVLISETTFRFLKGTRLAQHELTRKSIKIKHHSEDIPAYEVNPYASNQELMDMVERNYLERASNELVNRSWHILDAQGFRALLNDKTAELFMFTAKGLYLRSFLEIKGTEAVKLSFEANETLLESEFQTANLTSMVGEIQALYENPDHSHTYHFTAHEQDAQAFSALIELLRRVTLTDDYRSSAAPTSLAAG